MVEPKEINQSKQLILEGRDAEVFFKAMLKYLGLNNIQIQNFGGIKDLRAFLKAFYSTPGFLDIVTSIGIIRDAELDAKSAFQSVCGALRNASLAVPQKPMLPRTDSIPQINIFILPDLENPGMLETLCLQSVANDPVMQCIDQYFNCIDQRIENLPKNMEKAKLQAFLASRSQPGLKLGEAANAKVWNFETPAFAKIREFLLSL